MVDKAWKAWKAWKVCKKVAEAIGVVVTLISYMRGDKSGEEEKPRASQREEEKKGDVPQA